MPATDEAEKAKRMKQRQPVAGSSKTAALRASLHLPPKTASSGPQPNITQTPLAAPEGAAPTGQGQSASGIRGAALVASIQAAISTTKGDAKKLVKPDLAKILESRAMSKADDPVLNENLRNASKAGVKIAGVREKRGLGVGG